jgi:hypothetical protein
MNTWQPGQPILTMTDYEQWQQWRKCRVLEAQRKRRARLRRIDYYPNPETAKVIDSLTEHSAGSDYSSVIDRLVLAAGDDLPE